ncbi:MAG: bifunctional (p)ppGpp synthetase/guanosine-3',5'-bis(diphosphate) 3'-pyrophosphohydrolase [Acidobacteria bacterium]|nr:bifunctional (p)ppGpp synthetase/guanosine-3',5'-bis(diphosphate) 3'-pyrophosphohydrolase [Acidobacteriota bacterium]
MEVPSVAVSDTPAPSPADLEFQKLLEAVQKLRPSEDTAPLVKAYEFAKRLHEGQFRKSGEPYLMHPIAVCETLADAQMDMVCLCTGMLHDVVEDTPTQIEEIAKEFGPEVARCVDGVTKLSKVDFYSVEQRQAESVRKMLLAMVTDIRVILVKFADRLHNMRTLYALSPEKQKRIATETIEIYAPLAHRLGMGKIRAELEDLAFRYVDPEASEELIREIESKRAANEQYLAEVVRVVEAGLRREQIPARVQSRVKRAYSVYLKLKRQKIGIDQVYDLLAVRIITDSVKHCYAALGVIHNEWHPIPGRIKDFIAIPRPNLYQSLHTSVIGPGGLNVEIQIRTEEMHRIAEEGIAAHWKYKEGRSGAGGAEEQRIAWLRSLVEWQRDMRDSSEFMSTLKIDLYPEEVYTFTPQGKVIVLPRDATPIDFAYEVHSNVGNECVGAKVNGRIVPLKYQLKNGDVVEILRQNGHLPSKDWLAVVKTSKARNKIKHVINTTERAKAIEIGEKYLEREARRLGASLSRFGKAELEAVANEYGFTKMEDLHAALGYGKYSARQVLLKLNPELERSEPQQEPPAPKPHQQSSQAGASDDLTIKVSGADDLLLYRAKCCNPIRGDAIVGFVTRGKGIAVHSVNCTNVTNLMYEPERRIEVEWARAAQESFAVKMMIYTDDRPGMLSNVTTVLYDENANIKTLEARPDPTRQDDSAVIDTTIEVKDKKQLDRILSAVRRISGVRDVERAS